MTLSTKKYPDRRISREELVAHAEDLAPVISTYVAFFVLSTIIATAGLLLDSAATIIGAIVIAPLMGPAISASFGTVIYDRKLASRGIILQVGGLILAVAFACEIGLLVKDLYLLPPRFDIRQVPNIGRACKGNSDYVQPCRPESSSRYRKRIDDHLTQVTGGMSGSE